MRRFEGAASLSASVVILFLSIPCLAQDRGAQIFVEKCSPCHSVGGGDLAGPDLIRAARLSSTDVRAALHRMEDNVGPLSADDVEALLSFLKSPRIKQLIGAAPAATEEPERGSPATGRRLFYGDARFANGGSPCFACHTVGGRGGNLAVDLTLAHTRMTRSAVVAATAQPAFPLMKAAYARHAITEQESFDLAAFLKEAGAAAKPGAQPRERAGVVQGAAAGAAAVVLAGVGLIRRTRRRPMARR
jgi:mono/diheme cytochrome c family protein